jgi:hydroxyacylglutathione hydrolase
MKLIPLPAFQDNYLWLLHDGQRALVVGVEAILVTHRQPHAERVGAGAKATGTTAACQT